MEKLNRKIIKHLAYNPIIEILNYKSDYVGIQYAKTNGFYYIKDDLYITYEGGSAGKNIVSDCRLLLRPLPDLTKEIEVNGKKFIPYTNLWEDESYIYVTYKAIDYARSFIYSKGRLNLCYPFDFWQKLFEWHFNVFELPEHLWIDINTLKK